MVDRSDTSRENTTSYAHPQETNLLNVHKAMEYNALGQPIIRTVQSSSGYEPSGTDAFGRLQVAAPQTLLDSQNVYKENQSCVSISAWQSIRNTCYILF